MKPGVKKPPSDTRATLLTQFSCLGHETIPHPIPELQALNKMVSQIKEASITPNFNKTIVVGAQHILETTSTLFEALIKLGIDPNKIYLTGKPYSTSETVAKTFINLGIQLMPDVIPGKPGEYQSACRRSIRRMWQQVQTDLRDKHQDVDTIIIVDDGFRCLEEMPPVLRFDYKVAGIEQTRGGLYSSISMGLPFPLIEVASSATKRHLEAPMIATAVFKSIKEFVTSINLQRDVVCGVVGNGAIGEAIASYLLKTGFKVVVFDTSPTAFSKVISNSNLFRLDSIESVIINAECIFGCTGKDITDGIDILNIAKGKRKIFISTTSEDREFLGLLKVIGEQCEPGTNPLDDINFKNHDECEIVIKNGGYPVNFDRAPWNVPAEDIELTQCLMLGAFIQATICAVKPVGDGVTLNKISRQMLDPNMQSYIVNIWKQISNNKEKYSSDVFRLFENAGWITDNSGGEYHENEQMSQVLATTTQLEFQQLSSSNSMG
ncbi:MAG: hypothetical protein KAS93_07355 [Gammaproteobacteria bacterium]|nr:hypothetical protein [Gammaproteobacteria bacterium]